ncbi:hypothetical protein PP713_13850 [Mycobacterium sp. CSUR Q5927]|nr:hypothetical protein [Mycobacterium sp. CSUR Q5927]
MNIFDRVAHHFGLTPLSDVDLPDEPKDPVSQLERRLGTDTEASSPGLVRRLLDGPTAPGPHPGAVGHLPTDWANIRRDLAHLRSVLREALVWIDEIDPAPHRLAPLADVTDIRKGRSPHP